MNSALKKTAAFILVGLVVATSVIALLAIWDIISLENVMRKLLSSIFVLFLASVVLLFIFGVVIRDDHPNKDKP